MRVLLFTSCVICAMHIFTNKHAYSYAYNTGIV